jgi:hypothetical protein
MDGWQRGSTTSVSGVCVISCRSSCARALAVESLSPCCRSCWCLFIADGGKREQGLSRVKDQKKCCPEEWKQEQGL